MGFFIVEKVTSLHITMTRTSPGDSVFHTYKMNVSSKNFGRPFSHVITYVWHFWTHNLGSNPAWVSW